MPGMLRRIAVLAAAVTAVLGLAPLAAFSNAEIGSTIERRELLEHTFGLLQIGIANSTHRLAPKR